MRTFGIMIILIFVTVNIGCDTKKSANTDKGEINSTKKTEDTKSR